MPSEGMDGPQQLGRSEKAPRREDSGESCENGWDAKGASWTWKKHSGETLGGGGSHNKKSYKEDSDRPL